MAKGVGELAQERQKRAQDIAVAGGVEAAMDKGVLPHYVTITVSEGIILGLLRQNVRRFVVVLGHGSTELGEILRIYDQAGLVKTYPVRNEIAGTHAVSALRWVTGEKAAMVTSIGPGALQAFAASLVPVSNGLGVYILMGDETMEDEGPNMQQIPGPYQNGFLKAFSQMSAAYSLHTPGSLPTALRRGMVTVDHPYRAAPFFLLMPMNTQAAYLENFNTGELPVGRPPAPAAAVDDGSYRKAAELIHKAERVVVRVGGGARGTGEQLERFLELADGVSVVSPVASGTLPFDHPRNMTVGGSKGSLSGNFAMEHADLLVAVGSRFVCQSDSSRTGYPNVFHVVNINTDVNVAMHYGKTTALVGDAALTLEGLNDELAKLGPKGDNSEWFAACKTKRKEWDKARQERYNNPTIYDKVWQRDVLSQPAAIKTAVDWAKDNEAVNFFDAGDVQANGFQVVEDDRPGQTFTDTGASYMGFAVSALLATALADKPFYGIAYTGDGSFTMNPQILIDGAYHGATGCILLLDNRRMAAISALQRDQYEEDHATNDDVAVDYVQWARSVAGIKAIHGGYTSAELRRALDEAKAHNGLTLIHVPVYYGGDPMGGLGVYGRWNVGNWVHEAQAIRHNIGL